MTETAMGQSYFAHDKGNVVTLTGTNRADAQYRYEHEVVRNGGVACTRKEWLHEYAASHKTYIATAVIPPPQEW